MKLDPKSFATFLGSMCGYFERFGLEDELALTRRLKAQVEAGDRGALAEAHARLGAEAHLHGSGLHSVHLRLGWFLERWPDEP